MKWQGRRGSNNIEDRRSAGPSMGRSVGGAGGIGGVGIIVVLVVGYFLGIDVTPLLRQGGPEMQQGGDTPITAEDEKAAEFVSVTLADTEEIWAAIFKNDLGRTYTPATLVLFKDSTASACGGASEATGPFYCPTDTKVYLDTAFFTTLSRELGAQGDFAMAYVVAHEIAHHVQDELGILGKANEMRTQVSEAESNEISVRIELQADCFAGIWARNAQQRFGSLESGDLDEALNAAKKIGDDTLQKAAGRRPMPDSFTHGTSQQRSTWLKRGYETGQLDQCDTFSAPNL